MPFQLVYDPSYKLHSGNRLFELPAALLEQLTAEEPLGSENRPTVLQLRGLKDDSAVLCTPVASYDVRQVHVSNALLIVQPRLTETTAPDLADPASSLPELCIRDVLDHHIEVEPCPPRFHRIRSLMQSTAYRGPEYETLLLQDQTLLTWTDLSDQIQLDDGSLGRHLFEEGVMQLDGYYRLIDPGYLRSVIQLILATLTIEDIPLDRVPSQICIDQLQDHGIPPTLIVQTLQYFSLPGKNESGPGLIFSLDLVKLARFMACQLLEAEPQRQWPQTDFHAAWQALVPESAVLDWNYLRGLVIKYKSDRDQLNYLRYFPARDLPTDTNQCFRALFQTQAHWNPEEMQPFLEHLAVSSKKLDALILKFCRISKQQGHTVYSSRLRTH
ncbi:sister chromatid cohesion protein Dcc1 [Dimargaris cristalligena]|uniref:Sister chromatid cohesion protein Dcc1 n=1 Tax=Dimargaris cristalligena TaxID=215637 RepID=A0A4P9ZVR7_9FUNG|nr:sister chromatid cohesion protein Dcc1 [Dimargaris cristalligena]|eukprot:RKP37704.1 sister chromatid cohesion protein Dcc1 [Dimargaris cristalligena]